jgi:5'-nucleotidase
VGELAYGPAAHVAHRVAAEVIRRGLAKDTLLNVNVPYLPLEALGDFRVTRMGLRVYRDQLVRRLDPRGRPYYWIGGEAPTGAPDAGTDIGTLKDGAVSITPLQLDLTSYPSLEQMQGWTWGKGDAG